MSSTVWLTLGTFTALRVPAPSRVDRRTAGAAMVLAPAAGVLLAIVPAALVGLGDHYGVAPLLPAVAAIGVVAWGTRGLHLDGLADTADGLAASYDRARALEIMRKGDTGPAGTAVLVLVLLAQAAALSAATTRGRGVLAVVLAVVVGRAVVSMACVRGVRAARSEGLGATVAESVPRLAAVAVGLAVAVLAGALWTVVVHADNAWLSLPAGVAGPIAASRWWVGPLAVVIGYAAAALLLRRCLRRLGGITGDVIGACVETATLTTLAAVALL